MFDFPKIFVVVAAALLCTGLTGCVEPPPPVKTVVAQLVVDGEGCPAPTAPIAAELNDKISWSLRPSSEGYTLIEAFGIAFEGYNPTYCVNSAWVNKSDDVTCTVKVDARQDPVCYVVSMRSNGGQTVCRKRFVLQVGGAEAPAGLCNTVQ